MKVLFLCRANKFRSPIAEALFNQMLSEHTAISAGSEETHEGRLLPGKTILTLKEEGIEVGSQKSQIVTRNMVKKMDKVIVLCEKRFMPDFVVESEKTEYWNIQDPETGLIPSLDSTKKIIREKILEMHI